MPMQPLLRPLATPDPATREGIMTFPAYVVGACLRAAGFIEAYCLDCIGAAFDGDIVNEEYPARDAILTANDQGEALYLIDDGGLARHSVDCHRCLRRIAYDVAK
jgi:hypothetical protein